MRELVWGLGILDAGEEDEGTVGGDIGGCDVGIALVVAGVWAAVAELAGWGSFVAFSQGSGLQGGFC